MRSSLIPKLFPETLLGRCEGLVARTLAPTASCREVSQQEVASRLHKSSNLLRYRQHQFLIPQNIVGQRRTGARHDLAQFGIDLRLIWLGAGRLGTVLEEVDHVEVQMDICAYFDLGYFPRIGSDLSAATPRNHARLDRRMERALSCFLHKIFAIYAPQS